MSGDGRSALGDAGVLYQVLRRLGAEDLARASCVAATWHDLGGSHGLWKPLCAALWEGKAHVPPRARELLAGGDGRGAYVFSVEDARREVLTVEELTGFTWYRRMKQSSGGHWTSSGPYWQGQPPNRSVYSADGSLTFLQTPGFEHPMLSGEGGPPTMAWRWARGSCGRLGPPGTFLRMSLRGREFPTMMVSRHRATWGWVMDNCWAVAASFPLPPPGSDPEMEDDALPATIETQAYEARCFNLGLPRLPEPGGGEEEEDNPILSQLLAAIHGGEEEEVEEEDGDEVEAVEEAEDGGGGGDEAEQPAHVATPEEHDRSYAPGGSSTEEPPQPARAEVNEASASTFEPVAAAGMDAVAASQWLEDFDARWDSMKRRFDRVMSASLVQIAASMSTPDVEENGPLVQQE